MPTVTAIKLQKAKNRVNVYLDNKFGFGLDLEIFVVSKIKVGNNISFDEINEISAKDDYKKYLDRLINFCTLRPRSKKEITDWLRRKKVFEEFYDKLFEKLTKLELVNDYNFAKWWVGQRNTFRPRSKRQLEYELKNKGIAKDLIEKVINKEDVDDVLVASKLLKKINYKWSKLDKLEAKKKKMEYLARKGFEWEVIKKVV